MRKIVLISILVLAFFLRFYRLNEYPALNADEAAIGYNAYSLIETGRDEHGNKWPIHFQSFNDYKPGLYFYLALPFVKFFGLNEWSVRIPNAATGVLTVLIAYFLARELFPEDKKPAAKFRISKSEIAAFTLAISPWHIHFSRGGWEVNTATFFMVLGTYLFLKGKKNLSIFMLSALSFALSLYTYHAARIVSPLIVLGLVLFYREEIKINFKNYLLAGLVGLVAVLPLAKDLLKPEISARAAGVGLFADTGPLSRINEQRGEHSDYSDFFVKALHNKAVNYGLAFVKNWADHYHGLFLFLSGDDIQRDKVPETGQVYLVDLIWIGIGFFWLLKNLTNGSKIVLWWLFIAPTAAALTFQSPHALRSENMVIPLTLISALGLSEIIGWLNKKGGVLCISGYSLVLLLVGWNFARYQHMYWTHLSKEYPFSSQYGVKELVSYIKENEQSYKKVIVTDRYDQPYILFLFYLKYPPRDFQKSHELTARDKFGFSTVRNFDRYEFRSINWDKDQPENPNSLIVGTDEEIPDEANIVKDISGTNGYKYFQVVAN